MAKKFWIELNEDIPAIQFSITQPPPSADGNDFAEITDPVKIKELYLQKYISRIEDGKKYVLDFTADRYIDVLNGVYTEAEAFELESHIKDIYVALNNGWWLTAKNANEILSLSGIYDQLMKDDIQSNLNTYITDNY
jgi:hypothetical protein